MKYVKFEISKFKGIDHEIIDLSKIPQWKIFPLVWLNESWKTTILEAINFFQEEMDDDKKFTYIHKKDLANFTWEITCSATLQLNNDDNKFIRDFCKQKKLILKNDIDEISIKKVYHYTNSKYQSKENLWTFQIMVKTSKERNYKSLFQKNKDVRNELTIQLRKRFPKILYFSDFLFSFPEKIYLEDLDERFPKQEQEINSMYKNIFNDVFSSVNCSINDFLQKKRGWDSWNSADGAAANAILKRVSSALNKNIIIPRWEIFPWPQKDIEIQIFYDSVWYYFNIDIGIWDSRFKISDMSLWFRRFFSFILFTEFRKARDEESWEYLFLFDEPASNLHEHSQQKLLTIFDRIVGNDKAKIIYSTHSPYLINPKYILNAFVVKDEWRNNIEDEFVYRQNIKATSYRKFVAQSVEDYSHFKPILDALDFATNPFELTNNIIFTEWKHDYYTFKRIKEKYFNKIFKHNFYPWWWVTSYAKVFREYIANNRKFIWIFDWDDEWKESKDNYIKDISKELESHIFTLNDIDKDFNGKTTEFLFTDDDRLKIQKTTFPDDTEYDKNHFNKAIEDIFINNKECELSEDTLNNFETVLKFIKDNIK